MILVTGATGLNGLLTAREFARNKQSVRVLVRSSERATQVGLTGPSIQVVEGDMKSPATLGEALDGIERALMISTAAPDMLETQCRFIDACKAAGVRHVVKFSGEESGIGFDPSKFHFTKMHEEIEDYLEDSGLAWTHIRPSQFMQVYLREARSIVEAGQLRLPFESIALAPVDAEDIAKISFLLLVQGGNAGESLRITGPEALTMTNIADRISDAVGRNISYVPIDAAERRVGLLKAGVPAGFIDALDEQLEERLKHPVSRVDLTTHHIFGVKPTTFAEFAEKYAEALGKMPHAKLN